VLLLVRWLPRLDSNQ